MYDVYHMQLASFYTREKVPTSTSMHSLKRWVALAGNSRWPIILTAVNQLLCSLVRAQKKNGGIRSDGLDLRRLQRLIL